MDMSTTLPTVGSEIACTQHASDVPLRVDVLGILRLDFTGILKYRVESTIDGGRGVNVKLAEFESSADSPVLGKVTISRRDADTPLGVLELVSDDPPRFKHTTFLDFEMTIEKPPGGGPPLVLANTKTMTLLNTSLTAFPPDQRVYQQQQPTDLAPVGSPNQVVAQLQQYPVTVTHTL
jgi:hypothetical protein